MFGEVWNSGTIWCFLLEIRLNVEQSAAVLPLILVTFYIGTFL